MGFGPQLVDFDGDGRVDIISGDWPGHIMLFRSNADGSFAPGQAVKDGEGKEIAVDYGAVVFAVDWDADGDLDVLMGTTAGDVHLIRNKGTRRAYAFARPEKLQSRGQAIAAPGGDAAPVAVDWDGDGKLDLLLGSDDGVVRYYRNIGTPRQPELDSPVPLIRHPDRDSDRGWRVKLCVTDWNADGRLDLVIGDHGDEFDKPLEKEEEQWRDHARRQQSDLLKSWAGTFRAYRELTQASEPEDADQKQRRQRQIDSLRGKLQELNRVRELYYCNEQALLPGKQYHGRVWLYLRK